MPYNALQQARLPRVGSLCGLGLDLLGIHTLSQAAQKRTATNSGTLANGVAKVQAAREYDRAPIDAITSEWKEKYLNPSMEHTTMEETEIVCRLDHTGRIADKQESATALLRDEIQMQDFAKPVASRVSRVLGQSVAFTLHRLFLGCVVRRVPLVLDSLLFFCASSAMVCVRHNDVELDAKFYHGEAIFSKT